VVRRVLAVPGDTVRPGQALFILRLTSETLQSSQTELYKAAQDLKIAQETLKRNLAGESSLPERIVREARLQVRRLEVSRKAHRQDLATRGLTPEQIDQVEGGRFLGEITVRVPGQFASAPSPGPCPLLEVEELKVQLGEQVQAGHVLCLLADHQSLYVEGRGFKEDAPLVARSAEHGWPVDVSFTEDRDGDWPALTQELTIQYLANAIDPTSQTFPFYVPLSNQHREYSRAGKTYRLWRFRPGQRVRLGVRVRKFEGVFVLPADAVVRAGPDAFVFRQNGDAFDRKAVHVVFEDHHSAVIANDGSITPGNYIAHNAAVALERARKAKAAGDEGGHGHDHHHHHH
jgi:multidrug efflux pump subunit AcrA (membrane-fusion protein)